MANLLCQDTIYMTDLYLYQYTWSITSDRWSTGNLFCKWWCVPERWLLVWNIEKSNLWLQKLWCLDTRASAATRLNKYFGAFDVAFIRDFPGNNWHVAQIETDLQLAYWYKTCVSIIIKNLLPVGISVNIMLHFRNKCDSLDHSVRRLGNGNEMAWK